MDSHYQMDNHCRCDTPEWYYSNVYPLDTVGTVGTNWALWYRPVDTSALDSHSLVNTIYC